MTARRGSTEQYAGNLGVQGQFGVQTLRDFVNNFEADNVGIIDLFSKRQKRQKSQLNEIYKFVDLPKALRVQIVHIWRDALGDARGYGLGPKVVATYQWIVESLCREYGEFHLVPHSGRGDRDYMGELINFFLIESDNDKVLDVIELTFQAIDTIARSYNYFQDSIYDKRCDAAIEELNVRFQEHAIGFQFSGSELIRVDSQFIHSQVVKPVLQLLSGQHYAGAQEEFLRAHEHYRKGNSKEALNECLKSFESVMRAICVKRKWAVDKKATARDLIQVCMDNQLIPDFWQSHYSSLRSMLESGIPTARNRLGGHGQGVVPTTVPDSIVACMLHMTASAVVFLATAETEMK